MTRHLRIDDLAAVVVPEQPALSPDASICVYVLRTHDVDEDRTARSIWRVGTTTGQPERLTTGPDDIAPAWSPDGTRVAFLRGGETPHQICVIPVGGGEVQQLTSLPLGAGAPVWSPDGGFIAFAANVDLVAEVGEDDTARARRAGAPVVTDRLDYRFDGAGLLRGVRKHLFLLDPGSGRCRQVTCGDWHAGEPAWSPDSTRLAFPATTGPDPDLAERVPLHVLDVSAGGAIPQLVGSPDANASAVIWTADASALLMAGRTNASVGHDGLHRVPLGGGEPWDLAGCLDRNVMSGGPAYPGAPPKLARDGRTVLFCARDHGCTHLYSVGVDGGDPVPVLVGAGRVVDGVCAIGETAALVISTATSFGEVVTVDLRTNVESVRTQHGAGLADIEWLPREERDFTISDGTVVQAWLIQDRTRSHPQPLLLDIHGGPHNAWNAAADELHLYQQELASRGWLVLLVNPRGSDGYGEQFFKAALGAWGEADAKDFLEPIDGLVEEGLADPSRLAVTGYSYGGFMTCYLTSRDTRFAAAVAGGVVSDLVSMVGTSDIGQFIGENELLGRPWSHPARYDAMSPIARVDEVRTPTLILQGADDIRCPVGQAQQWHAALRGRHVPTQLVLYPGGSHLFILDGPPSHRMDFNRRTRDWIERFAPRPKGSLRASIDARHWRQRLHVLIRRHQVPGAALGIMRVREGQADDLVEIASGVLSTSTRIEVTPDSIFQIGSITKVWTATLVMQLVDDGLLDLDAPIIEALPQLSTISADVSKHVTMRHLLNHTSGIDGDVFTDTGRGNDCIEKYVSGLDGVAQIHQPGATWSYCNSGFVIAGRVIEEITGATWDQALSRRITGPLRLSHTSTLPEDALLFRSGVGHLRQESGELSPVSVWGLPRSLGPAGLVNSTVADVLGFARMHLTGGRTPDGRLALSSSSVCEMTQRQAELPDQHTVGNSWGLGWTRYDWGGRHLVGHDGNTIGQAAFLRLVPDEDLAVVLLTNGGYTRNLYEDLFAEILGEVAGVEMPRSLAPPANRITTDLDRHTGTYERASERLDVFVRDSALYLRRTVTGPLADLVPDRVQEFALVAVTEEQFVIWEPDQQAWAPVTFFRLPSGERYVHHGARAAPRVG